MQLAPRVITAGLALAALLVALALLPAGAAAAQCKGGDVSPTKLSEKRAAKAVLCLINKARRNHRLKPLKRHRAQTKAAKAHNRRMVKRRCFSHRCPGEPDLAGRLTRTGYLPCSCSWGIAENIAFGSGGAGSPRSIVDAWMHSAGHRANILSRSYRHVGVAAERGTPAAGRQRDGATYTTDFGYKR
jgi:uncharacterized protein YkwD